MGLAYLNRNMQAQSLGARNDFWDGGYYPPGMAAPRHDWFLKEWLRSSHKKQADLVKDLDWNKAKASLMARGLQPYTRDEVNEVADYLNIRPYELLMHPDDAHALRRLRADMIRLAHESPIPEDETEQPKKVSMN